ncbi:hypothetical protein quinque_000160 [Culex quinquefasciatus]
MGNRITFPLLLLLLATLLLQSAVDGGLRERRFRKGKGMVDQFRPVNIYYAAVPLAPPPPPPPVQHHHHYHPVKHYPVWHTYEHHEDAFLGAVVLGRHDGEGRLGRRGGKIKSGKNGLAYLGALGASTFGGFDSSYHHGPTFSVYPSNYLHGGYAPSYGSYGHHGHKEGGFEQPKKGFHLGYEVGYQGHLGYIKLKRDNLRHVQVSLGLGRPGSTGGAGYGSAFPYATALLPILASGK